MLGKEIHMPKVREHADIWQIHSAANVMGTKLFMVFPDRNIRSDVRADMNRILLPQNFTKMS